MKKMISALILEAEKGLTVPYNLEKHINRKEKSFSLCFTSVDDVNISVMVSNGRNDDDESCYDVVKDVYGDSIDLDIMPKQYKNPKHVIKFINKKLYEVQNG